MRTKEQKHAIERRSRIRYATDPEYRQKKIDRSTKRRQMKIKGKLRKKKSEERLGKSPIWGIGQMLSSAKQSAKYRGLEFAITRADVYVPEYCPILGLRLTYDGGPKSPAVPSIDRISSDLGYVPGNVQVVCHRANILKQNATLYEMIALGEWAKAKLEGRWHEPKYEPYLSPYANQEVETLEGGDIGVYIPDLEDNECFLETFGCTKYEWLQDFLKHPLTERLLKA